MRRFRGLSTKICAGFALALALPLATAADFSVDTTSGMAMLTESNGEQLSIEISTKIDKRRNSLRVVGGRFNFKGRECFGELSFGDIKQDGTLVFNRLQTRRGLDQGFCRSQCSLILDPGWATYKKTCEYPNEVVGVGRFDGGRNVDTFNEYLNRTDFFRDPEGDRRAAALPPKKYRLEHEAEKYRRIYAEIPPQIKQAAKEGKRFDLGTANVRDIADAVLEVDSRAWRFNQYIPGSVTDIVSTADATRAVVKGKLTYADFQFSSAWRQATFEIQLEGGDVACIRYWNNSSCSANYFLITHPNTDTSLAEEDSKCMQKVDRTYTEVIPSRCLYWDSRAATCYEESPTVYKEHEYQAWKNVCARSLSVVMNCQQLFRKSVTIAPDQEFVAACTLERSFRK